MNINELEEYNFKNTHEIIMENGRPDFKLVVDEQDCSEDPSVYIWVGIKGRDYEPLYIGKAGKGVIQRFKEHKQGFKKNGTGKKKAENIKDYLSNTTYSISVYSRKSVTHDKFFSQLISCYSSEEDALCKKYNPAWNTLTGAAASQDASDLIALLVNKINIRGLSSSNNEQLTNIFESMDKDESKIAKKLIKKIDEIISPRTLDVGFIATYTDLPGVGSDASFLNWARYSPTSGRALANSWVARVALGADIKVIFPNCIKKNGIDDLIDSSKKSFSPKDTKDFIKSPDNYLNKDEVSNRIG